MGKKPILSVGIIFKNEIRCLERCLKSLLPLKEKVSCEIVMADTGSSDGSRVIAEKYADILFDFPWIDDFAAARNAVLDRSSGRWFMTLDADEWLSSRIEKLIEFIKVKQEKYFLLGYVIRNFKTPNVTDDDNFQDFNALRIMRTGLGIRYEGCIHEYWKLPETLKNKEIVMIDMMVYHDGYAFVSNEAMVAKHDRNMKLLKKKLEADPDSLQTLTECIDVSKTIGEDVVSYVRRSLEVLHRNWDKWGYCGARVYRDAVSTAQVKKLPELLEWANKANELYPDSIYTRIDVSYCVFSSCWDNGEMEGVIYWAEKYRQGLNDYENGKFDKSESFRGVLQYSSPYWKRRMLIMLTEAYLRLQKYEKARSVFEFVDGASIDEEQQIEVCTNMLMRFQRETDFDISAQIKRFWRQINNPIKSKKNQAEKYCIRFLNTAASALTLQYRNEEKEREKFVRHGYTVFLPLEGECVLGDAAAVLETTDPVELEAKLARQNLKDFPVSAIIHALQCGITFPLPSQPMNLEEMSSLVERMAPFADFAEMAYMVQETGGVQAICWKEMLILAAVRDCMWDQKEDNLRLVKEFARTENIYLKLYYSQQALENLWILPTMHRFGWYCVQAFDAFDAGDIKKYVSLLRKGLESCEQAKQMVEFLLENTEGLQETQMPQPSPELVALADQVRAILSNYAPDDPAVQLLKQSEAYQKVAYLIEGAAVPVQGGLAQ